jgi:polygalacturonase
MIKRTGLTLVVCVWICAAGLCAPNEYISVRDHGALGTGKVLDTKAIQKSIDEAAARGGGTVFFSAGTYLSGTLYMKDHVILHLDAGAMLLGSSNLNDYPVNRPAIRSYTDTYVERSLIAGENLQNIAITGRGTIDGNGGAFAWKEYLTRPYVIRLVNCQDVLIENIQLQNSPMWMQHYLACTGLTIKGIRVTNLVSYNNDGLDIDSCRDVIVSDCRIFSDDDALCLKSTTLIPCENVTITNCVVGSHCNAIKMGTESNGGFQNITISNCAIVSLDKTENLYGQRRGISGISLEIVDGGVMDRVAISNITMDGISVPLFIRLGNRARPFKEDSPRPGLGILKNISIENIIATNASKIACSITGQPGRPVENVVLKNISLHFEGGGTPEDAARKVEKKPEAYPEASMFGTLPAYGFFVSQVDNITFDTVTLSFDQQESRPALVFDDVANITVHQLQAQPAKKPVPLIVFNKVRACRVFNSVALPGTGTFLYLQDSAPIFISGNDLRNADKESETVIQ